MHSSTSRGREGTLELRENEEKEGRKRVIKKGRREEEEEMELNREREEREKKRPHSRPLRLSAYSFERMSPSLSGTRRSETIEGMEKLKEEERWERKEKMGSGRGGRKRRGRGRGSPPLLQRATVARVKGDSLHDQLPQISAAYP